jgi:hypothetical protein
MAQNKSNTSPERLIRALRLVIWTICILSPLPREWAQPATDVALGLWSRAWSRAGAGQHFTHQATP